MEFKLSMDHIKEIIQNLIDNIENVGEHIGGSGHLGNISTKIIQISPPIAIEEGKWQISYKYAVFLVTEFTYYPDNPPHESHYAQAIIVDNFGKIININPKETIDLVPNVSMVPDFKLLDDPD